MHKKLLFGLIGAIVATNAFANQIVTSQTYVDNMDALKQDKITAGTTGAVVTYNGEIDGQAQFSEQAIYDGTTTYDATTDANKLVTAGAVSNMAPALPTGTANAAVTYDANGNIGGERGIWSYDYQFYGGSVDYMQSFKDNLTTLDSVRSALDYVSTDITSVMPNGDSATRMLPVFRNDYDSQYSNKDKFWKVMITNSINGENKWDTYNLIPSLMAVNAGLDTKQSKKVCVRWLPDVVEQTDETCLLWDLPD